MSDPDRMDFWWDEKSQQYIEGTPYGPVHRSETVKMDVPVKKKLEDVNTRFQHLSDLQDYLGDGLLAVQNSIARYSNPTDVTRKTQLEGALLFLDAYEKQMANYDGEKPTFNKMLDENSPSKVTLDEIKSDRAAAAERAKAAKISEAQQGNGQLLLGPSSLDEDTPLSS